MTLRTRSETRAPDSLREIGTLKDGWFSPTQQETITLTRGEKPTNNDTNILPRRASFFNFTVEGKHHRNATPGDADLPNSPLLIMNKAGSNAMQLLFL